MGCSFWPCMPVSSFAGTDLRAPAIWYRLREDPLRPDRQPSFWCPDLSGPSLNLRRHRQLVMAYEQLARSLLSSGAEDEAADQPLGPKSWSTLPARSVADGRRRSAIVNSCQGWRNSSDSHYP